MYCRNCGQKMDSEFCSNCGFIENGDASNQPPQNGAVYANMPANQYNGYYDESGLFSENKLARINGLSANVTLKDWLKFICIGFLNLIPLLGSIAAIVMYLIIAFGSKSAKSMKSQVQASLIICAIFYACG